ncbi:hypothetical protein I546_2815 [Mycobacterium kansasii 732]|uniref:Uncharacterized protein n=1 Tax=Mycobacterium pseudokansasii TaxID=2341080 RepID=A0A498R1I0_9MYCO|nr:hypothetical protein [Mycobacterium pseudokansasii]EUA11348.1 hypothetical protein I546_2815 [Mycobacterium kansasii 732]MBY0390725.1 hypothetical protein [Mycobacterium pseudokansasii]VBA53804.1 hypothetical protein LAUMK142_04302 [Mycobacterium pseudokansasii]
MADQEPCDGYQPDEIDDDMPDTGEDGSTPARRVAGWQRALRWVAWLTFLGLAIAHSDREFFGPLELVALATAIGISVWCLAKPLGGPLVAMDVAADVHGTFVSRTNWALVLIAVALTVGGIGAIGAIGYDLSTGRATVHNVLADMGTFVAGWTSEALSGWSYDAHLEHTHAYALFVLVVPGLLLLWWNLVPLVKRGSEFRVEPDASISVRGPRGWGQLLEYDYAAVTADGTTIRFTPAGDATPAIILPQARVFSRETGTRLRSQVSAELFQQRLTRHGFTIEVIDAKRGSFRGRRGLGAM